MVDTTTKAEHIELPTTEDRKQGRDATSRTIHKAAGILQAAYFLHGRADQFRVGTARGKAIADALDQAADDLKTVALKTRDSKNED